MVSIRVDASQRHQTINGFGATLVPFELENFYKAHDSSQPVRVVVPPLIRAELARIIHQELGFSRARLTLNGFEPENDNADPNLIDWSRFFWHYRGGDLMGADAFSDYVNLARPFGLRTWFPTFQNTGAGEAWLRRPLSTSLDPALTDEYVEHLLAVALHFRDIGQSLEYLALQNEPTVGRVMSPEMMKDVVAKLGAQLRANGLSARLVVPDDVNPSSTLEYLEPILRDSTTRQYVGAIAYHSYDGLYDHPAAILDTSARGLLHSPVGNPRAQLRELSSSYNIPLWMSEVSSKLPNGMSEFDAALARANHVHDELTQTDVSAFDQMMLFFIHRPRIEESLFYVYFNPDGSLQRYEISAYGYLLGQYAREIVPGSFRVDATTADPLVRASAYQRPDGGLVVVAINNRNVPLTVNIEVRGAGRLPTQFRVRSSSAGGMWQAGAAVDFNNAVVQVILPAKSVTTLAP